MRDVAAAAGVSFKTVSRVINMEPLVDQLTVTRVEQAIEDLQYRRNGLARNLRKGIRQLTIGLIIEDLSNPFYAMLAQAVEEVADWNHHSIILTSSREDPERESRLVTDLLRRGVEGLLVVPAARDHRYLAPELRRGVRVVFLDRTPSGVDADTFVAENREGARRAVEHLVSYGHRRIAFLADPMTLETSADRYRGYADALGGAGLVLDERLVQAGSTSVDSAQTATRQLLAMDDPPTAIFAQNNRNCLGALRALRSVGARLALVGFDDFELATMLPTPVSVIANDPHEMGRRGAARLFERLSGAAGPPVRTLLPTRLIARGSGEIPVGAVDWGLA